ncbi:MAG: AmmeMemoRadiSam system protein B [Rhodospirillales bacterium]|nr:AmmeMemoRadiSam system protein B [Alphaproteobacteria bacterium]MBL6947498.1 AmmeMemoRadiSam system protein B [Rhodospirillales bacterium]
MTGEQVLVRAPAVAGQFYPAQPGELEAQIQGLLRDAEAGQGPAPKAIIAPHAGYIYSGAIAAKAYARLAPAADTITRVVLLGPCHRVAVQGLALSSADVFRTPLGDIPLDQDAAESLADFPQVQVFDATHQFEHSLEVHLPFLQRVLGDFSLVPLVVGEASPNDVADVIEALWGGPETVFVISTDLSHYLDYDAAREIDARTCSAIEALDPSAITSNGACGRFPVGGMLAAAKRRSMTITTLDLRNSGDTAGSKDHVVGYGAWMLQEAVK